MKLSSWYSQHFEARLKGRYITSKHIRPILNSSSNLFKISELGISENGETIFGITVGSGSKKVLAWSQMHGNESTTTKALFDFFKLLDASGIFPKEVNRFLEMYTLYCIPILNPDGALSYTRRNANDVDLNRDAQNLSQNESKILRIWFDAIQPDLCLNLHDQRTMYSLSSGKPATVSFLAPSADEARTVTPSRAIAMQEINKMNAVLQQHIPHGVGRYDDAFNVDCVGDTFQMAGVPTILFEAGHYGNDYQREKTRSFIFFALCSLFEFLEQKLPVSSVESYFEIPENEKQFRDVIIYDVRVNGNSETVDVSIRFEEELMNDEIKFTPYVDEIGSLGNLLAHKSIAGLGREILLNSHENVFVNEKIITIVEKNSKKCIFPTE